jgi:hypothetical protein
VDAPKLLTAWLDSVIDKSTSDAANPMNDAAFHFMFMMQALDESGLWPEE